MTYRSVETLKSVDQILCEDTRTSGKLLKHYGIDKPLRSYHQHNEHKILDSIIDQLNSGSNLALITDAGTPGISDPAFLLIRRCIQEDIAVETLPGATAFVPALINSGLPSEKFVFEGFLPHKKGRQSRLKSMAEEKNTMILYESTHRILKCLKQLIEYLGAERKASVSREITKMHEETVRGSLEEILHHFENNTTKGEFVIVIEGNSK